MRLTKLSSFVTTFAAAIAASGVSFGQLADSPPVKNPFYSSIERASIENFDDTEAESLITQTAFDDSAGSLESRFEALEAEWSKYKEGVDKKSAAAAKKPTYKIGGRLHLDHWAFPSSSDGIDWFEHPSGVQAGTDPEDRIQFRRLRVETKGDIFDTMLYDFDFDFATPGTVEIKDAYLGFKNLPNNQQFLIGNQKRPLGLDHLNSSRFNVFIERPMVVDAFNEDARRLGMAMYGYTDDEMYHWRYGIYNLANIKSSGKYIGDDYQLSGNARLSSSPWYDESSGGRGYFHWAVSGVLAHPDGNNTDTATNVNEARFAARPEARTDSRWIDTGRVAGAQWYEVLGLEAILNVGALQVTGEYQTTWMQRDSSTAGTGPDLQFQGGYIYAAYTLTGEHIPYDRKTGTIGRMKPFENFFLVDRCCGDHGTGWGLWQVAMRYSYLDLTDGDIEGGVENNWTVGLNWWWTSHSRLQFNAIYGTIDDHKPVGGFTEGDFFILGTRLAVDF